MKKPKISLVGIIAKCKKTGKRIIIEPETIKEDLIVYTHDGVCEDCSKGSYVGIDIDCPHCGEKHELIIYKEKE